MSTSLQFPKVIEDALLSVNPSTSRRNFLKSSGALVFSLSVSALPGASVLAQAVAPARIPIPTFCSSTPGS